MFPFNTAAQKHALLCDSQGFYAITKQGKK